MTQFEEQIKLLIELQGFDSEIHKLKGILGGFPAEIKALEDAFNARLTAGQAQDEAVKMIQLKRKDKEMDLGTKEEAIKKYKAQQYQVKTNKEYSAIQMEIGRAKADNSILEEEILKMFDEIDEAKKKLDEIREDIKAGENKLQAEKKEKEDESKKIEEQLKTLNEKRSVLAERVDKKILPQYERLLKSRDGLAIVPILGKGACQGCNRVQPPQVVNEVKMNVRVINCEYCNRMLYCEE
ncbi:MAG: C4-type zinc ribbon domain-containing protein [Candidatus Omnitrophota bacterium]